MLPFSAYFIFLSGRVVANRVQNDKWIGDNLTVTGEKNAANPLKVAGRCHSNFAENIPLALLLATVVEFNGGDRRVLSGSLGALFVLRILHVEFGLRGPNNNSIGRILGSFGTQTFIAGMAGYAAYLVKGYWGY
jgi:uncharacterized membrane protein YecN with MAPEG domain